MSNQTKIGPDGTPATFTRAVTVGNPNGYHEIPLSELNRVSIGGLKAVSPAPVAVPVLVPIQEAPAAAVSAPAEASGPKAATPAAPAVTAAPSEPSKPAARTWGA